MHFIFKDSILKKLILIFILNSIVFVHLGCTRHQSQDNQTIQQETHPTPTPTPTNESDIKKESLQAEPNPIPDQSGQKLEPNLKKNKEQLQAPSLNWLAQLKKRNREVDYRLHNESVWKKANTGHTFDRFDALQTQNSSQAQILYKSGSQLDVGENTLLVFDHDPGLSNNKKTTKEDRVIVKNGELSGITKTELWIFTNSGLIQIKAPKDKKNIAQAQISIRDGKKLNVKLNTGTADIIVPKNNSFIKLKMSPNSDIQFASQNPLFSKDSVPDESKLKGLSQASTQINATSKTDLIIDSPKDGINTNSKNFEVHGHLTELGGKLIINGELINVADDLTFIKNITLSEGANLIVFQLIRTDGSVEFFRRSIKLNKQE